MTIVLIWKYLRHDVEQLTHRYAAARLASQPEVRDEAEVGKNASDMQLVLRYVLTGTARLRLFLKDYLKSNTNNADDKLEKTEQWSFQFKSAEFDSEALAEYMHWFVVKWCMWQWSNVFSPNDAKALKDEVDEAEGELNDFLADSAMPIKEREAAEKNTEEEIIYYGANREETIL